MHTLMDKGEEAGHLAERLVQLKNHLLDQSLFEDSYLCFVKDKEVVFRFVKDLT